MVEPTFSALLVGFEIRDLFKNFAEFKGNI